MISDQFVSSLVFAASLFVVRIAARLPEAPAAEDLAAAKLDRAVRLAFLDALVHSGLTHKEAYLTLGFSKSHWSEMCSGVQPLPSITRLSRLGWRFTKEFLPRWAAAMVTQHVEDVEESEDMRRRA